MMTSKVFPLLLVGAAAATAVDCDGPEDARQPNESTDGAVAPDAAGAGEASAGDASTDVREAEAPYPPFCVPQTHVATFGDLHAHTTLSDGASTPDVFLDTAYARGAGFVVLTDHEYMANPKTQLAQISVAATKAKFAACLEKTSEAEARHPGFIARCGMEVLRYNPSIADTRCRFPQHTGFLFNDLADVRSLDAKDRGGAILHSTAELFGHLLASPRAFGQFNHPAASCSSWTLSERGYDAKADARMRLIEMSGAGASEAQSFSALFDFLDRGWHVTPVLNSDYHGSFVTPYKFGTGVWATPPLTYAALRSAIDERRVFASTDHTSTIQTMISVDGHTDCFGGTILSGVTSTSATLVVRASNAKVGFDKISLYRRGEALVGTFVCSHTSSDCTATFNVPLVEAKNYFVAKATVWNGASVSDWVVGAPTWIERASP